MEEGQKTDPLNIAGVAKISLQDYTEMRDTIVKLLNTTKTHNEFMKLFRKSLLNLSSESKKVGVNLDALLEFYQELPFKVIENMELVETSDKKGYILIIKPKDSEDERNSITGK